MNRRRAANALLAALAVIAFGAALFIPSRSSIAGAAEEQKAAAESKASDKPADAAKEKPAEAASAKALPKLVDLGADKCIPCRKMAPILEELKKDYAGKFDVVFIDVWKSGSEAKKYDISLIPTQIFFNADGKELFRHEGFFPKDDILAKWKELGVDVTQPAKTEPK